MKAFYFLIPLLIINSCKTQTGTVVTSEPKTMAETLKPNDGCPNDGSCTVVLHKNKSLVLKQDDFGGLYPVLEEGSNTVVEYTYSKKGPEGTVDGNYSETIHFEIPAGTNNMSKADATLKDAKLLYGKQCYCKGEAGFYLVDKGKLLLEKSNNAIMFDLQFKIDKTSQVVSHIVETVKL